MRDFIGSGITEAGPNKNVINILRTLIEDAESVLYIPYDYAIERIGKEGDPRVHFYPKDAGRPVKVVDIQGHKERFNFSLTTLVDVLVEYYTDAEGFSADSAVEGGKTHLVHKQVWRTYTVIRDGKLNITKMVAKLSASAYEDLLNAGLLMLGDRALTAQDCYSSDALYTIVLEGLPLVSPNWARPNSLNFHKMLREIEMLGEQISQCRKVLKESAQPVAEDSDDDVIYKERVQSYPASAGVERECIVYTVLANPGDSVATYAGDGSDLAALNRAYKDLFFRCCCIKWAMESAKSHRKSDYDWSDEYQKKAGSSRFYSEAVVTIDGVPYRLERCRFVKKF